MFLTYVKQYLITLFRTRIVLMKPAVHSRAAIESAHADLSSEVFATSTNQLPSANSTHMRKKHLAFKKTNSETRLTAMTTLLSVN